MRYNYELSPLEKIIFDILSESEKGLCYEDIMNLMPEDWNGSGHSVYTSLNRLKKNGVIKKVGENKIAKTRVILYSTVLTKDEFYDAAYREYFERMQHSSLSRILSAFTGAERKRDSDVADEVEDWLQKQREELEKK